MTSISRSALLPYPSPVVYELINDVAAYPEFMQGCIGAEVLQRTEQLMEARLDLSKAGLSQSFITRNHLFPVERVELELLDGPFANFSGQWQLLALSDTACKVTLDLQFTLESRVLGAAARVLFNPMADNLVDAIVRRAKQLYG